MITLDYLVTSLIVVLIPGTGVVYTVSTGIFLGRRASLFAAIGCTLGIVPHLLASVLGLAAVLHLSAMAFSVLKFAGAAYLLYLAWATWREGNAMALDGGVRRGGARDIVLKAFLMNILNPKLSIFFLAFLPQFIVPETTAPLRQMLILSGVFMLMTLLVFVLYGLVAHAFRAHVVESRRVQDWMRRGFAAVFAVLGLKLALSER